MEQTDTANHIPDNILTGLTPPENETGQQILARTKFDPRAPRQKKRTVLAFQKDGIQRRFGTLGNISLIIGKAKSKKTFLVSLLTSAALKNGTIQNSIVADFPSNKSRIVYFDTEQDNEDLGAVIDRAFALAGGSAETLDHKIDIYNLSTIAPAKRILAIGDYLAEHTDIGLVVLDGVRDITYDINDSSQAMTAITTLIKWVRDYGVHLSTVLHQNKGDENARGHLGTECVNRAETVVDISPDGYDKTVSVINPNKCRAIAFEPFYFTIDDHGMPVILDSYTSGEKRAAKVTGPNDIDERFHKARLSKIFGKVKQLSGHEFASAIRNEFGEAGIKLGDHASRDYVTYYKTKEWVNTKHGARNATFFFLDDQYDDVPF